MSHEKVRVQGRTYKLVVDQARTRAMVKEFEQGGTIVLGVCRSPKEGKQ